MGKTKERGNTEGGMVGPNKGWRGVSRLKGSWLNNQKIEHFFEDTKSHCGKDQRKNRSGEGYSEKAPRIGRGGKNHF